MYCFVRKILSTFLQLYSKKSIKIENMEVSTPQQLTCKAMAKVTVFNENCLIHNFRLQFKNARLERLGKH